MKEVMATKRERFEAWVIKNARSLEGLSHKEQMLMAYEAGQTHAESVGPADDYDQKAVDVIKNLAMLVRRLARRLEKHEPGCKMVTQALEYLRGENLQGSILREAESLSGDGATDELVIELCRELYDRFVMGGWEPQDAHEYVRSALQRNGEKS